MNDIGYGAFISFGILVVAFLVGGVGYLYGRDVARAEKQEIIEATCSDDLYKSHEKACEIMKEKYGEKDE